MLLSLPLLTALGAFAAAFVLWALLFLQRVSRTRQQVKSCFRKVEMLSTQCHSNVPRLIEAARSLLPRDAAPMRAVELAQRNAVSARNHCSQHPAEAKAWRQLVGAEILLRNAINCLYAAAGDSPALRQNQDLHTLKTELTLRSHHSVYAQHAYENAVRAYRASLQILPAKFFARRSTALG